jgi:hypothetical protein
LELLKRATGSHETGHAAHVGRDRRLILVTAGWGTFTEQELAEV